MLKPEEIAFLKKHHRSESDVFDGREMSQVTRRSAAKKAGKDIVLGSPCEKAGHRLRTRHGHCVQCDTSKLAYSTRHSVKAFVYVAYSVSGKLSKIGMSKNIEERTKVLNIDSKANSGYADLNDWQIHAYVLVPNAGRLEFETQRALSRYSVEGSYTKEGKEQSAGELYDCSAIVAIRYLSKAIQTLGLQAEETHGLEDD